MCVCCIFFLPDTGNACKHEGYEEFNPPSWPSECAPNKEDWIQLDRYICGEGGPTGISYPEEFWACSDFAITPGEKRLTPFEIRVLFRRYLFSQVSFGRVPERRAC